MLLSVENLRVSYDNIKALHGISFEIDEGEIVWPGAVFADTLLDIRVVLRRIGIADVVDRGEREAGLGIRRDAAVAQPHHVGARLGAEADGSGVLPVGVGL